jgi:hypothetical protein
MNYFSCSPETIIDSDKTGSDDVAEDEHSEVGKQVSWVKFRSSSSHIS